MATTEETRLRKKLIKLAERQRDVQERLVILLGDSGAGAGEIDRARREQNRLAAEQERLFADLELAWLDARESTNWAGVRQDGLTWGVVAGRRPMRELALDVLEEVGVPAAPSTVSEFAACFGLSIPASRFSSLRRDEQRAYRKNPLSRPAFVVPAISAVGLTAVKRVVCSSAWEDERRVIGSRSLHVNHLKFLLALLAASGRAPRVGEANVDRIWALVTRYAMSVPGALKVGKEPNRDRIEAAAMAELERVEAPDEEERREVAEKMARMSDFHRLWGLDRLWGRPVAGESSG